MTGTLTRKTEPHQKCSSSQPDAMGPMAAPPPEMPAQMPMALGRSCGGEHVGEDRQRRRHDERRRHAHDRPGADDHDRRVGHRREHGADEEQQEAGLEGALAAEPVADGAGGEQQAGEDERVGVDHPLQRAGGGVELTGQGGEGHVEAGVADDDDHQAECRARPGSATGARGRRGRSRARCACGGGGVHGTPLQCGRRFRYADVSERYAVQPLIDPRIPDPGCESSRRSAGCHEFRYAGVSWPDPAARTPAGGWSRPRSRPCSTAASRARPSRRSPSGPAWPSRPSTATSARARHWSSRRSARASSSSPRPTPARWPTTSRSCSPATTTRRTGRINELFPLLLDERRRDPGLHAAVRGGAGRAPASAAHRAPAGPAPGRGRPRPRPRHRHGHADRAAHLPAHGPGLRDHRGVHRHRPPGRHRRAALDRTGGRPSPLRPVSGRAGATPTASISSSTTCRSATAVGDGPRRSPMIGASRS